uniref:DNA N-6-adenine-methyltransferase n=1 Tax=Parabacteroides distasonis TaxID=823 RepID=UPI003FF11CD0
MKRKGMSSHQSARSMKTEWLTPPWLIDKIGLLDLDPCAPVNRPWDTAKEHYTILDNGLMKEWHGLVWCNPPYDEAGLWLKRLADHGNGIALIFARTETKMFFDYVWERATAVFFIKNRLFFHHVTGERAKSNGGAPSVLVAYGNDAVRIIRNSGLEGKLLEIK